MKFSACFFVILLASGPACSVTGEKRNALPLRADAAAAASVLRFDIPPRTAEYAIERTP